MTPESKRDCSGNRFYLFIPAAAQPGCHFNTVLSRLEGSQLWDPVPRDTRYLFRYISDKFGDTSSGQCVSYVLNRGAMDCLGIPPDQEWRVERPLGRQKEISYLRITGVQLWVFRTGMGILSLEMEARESDPLYISSLQFWLRNVDKPGHGLRHGEEAELSLLTLAKRCLHGIFPREPDYFFYANPQQFRANVLTYLQVDARDGKPEESEIRRQLYYLRGCCSRDYAYRENPELEQQEIFSSVDDITWGVSSEAAACIALVTEKNQNFVRRVFAGNFSRDYRFLYVLLLHQKYVLYRFLTRIGIGMQNDLETLESYRAQLYEFETNFMFCRITEVPQYQLVYEKVSQVFSLRELYDDVDRPLNELGEQRRQKREGSLNTALTLLALLACVSAMTDGFAFLDAYASPALQPWGKVLCTLAVIGTLALVIRNLLKGKLGSLLRRLSRISLKKKEEAPVNYLYTGWFFDAAALETALAPLGLTHLQNPIAYPHVTAQFLPEAVPEALFGTTARITVVGYGNDGKNEGVQVRVETEDPELQKLLASVKVPHITLSVGPEGKPVNTGRLRFTPVEPIVLTGTFGGFTRKQKPSFKP